MTLLALAPLFTSAAALPVAPVPAPAPALVQLAPSPTVQEGAAQESPEAQEAPEAQAEPVHLMSFGLTDTATWLTHPKDAALLRAFGMLEARLAELPSEIGDEMPQEATALLQPDSIATWMRILQAQKRVSLFGATPEMQRQGQPVLFGLGVDESSEDAATDLHARLTGLLQRMEAPFPMEMIRREGASINVGMGAEARLMGGTRAAALLDGDAAFEMEMNLGGYMQFVYGMAMGAGAPPEMALMFDVFERMGLNDTVIQVASASDGRVARTASVATGIGQRMQEAGMIPAEGVTLRDLAPIPADATCLSVQRLDLEAALEALNGLATELMRQQGIEEGDAVEMVASTIGVDLRTGLFGALGDTIGMYASTTTGGGGATSSVMFTSVRDLDALLDTKEQIGEILNSLADANLRGYVNMRTWTRGDVEYTTLMFPGLPIPMEPTMAFTEEWMVLAMTPQAALGAMGQIESGTPGIGANATLAAMANGSKNALSYMDTAHYARSGYGMTSLMTSAMSNAVRSRVDGLRDPGPILPVYGEFAEGIVPTYGHSEFVDGQIVTMQTTDGSTLVQAAASIGFLSEYAALYILPFMAAAAPQIMRETGFRF